MFKHEDRQMFALKLNNSINFHLLEVVDRDIQLPMSENSNNLIYLLNPLTMLTAKLFNLNFHPLKVSENYSDLTKKEVNSFQMSCVAG